LRFAYGFVRMGYPRLVENIQGDADDYLDIAYTVAKTGRYERSGLTGVKSSLTAGEQPEPVGSAPDAWRPPVWPWVLSLWLRSSGYSLRSVFILRFLTDGLTLWLFYRVASRRLPPGLALLGTFLLAIQPIWLYYSMTLLTEPFTLLVHLLLVATALRLAEGGRPAVWVPALGVLGGLAILTHGFYLFFPPLLVLGLWLAGHIRMRQALAVLGLFALTLAPWLLRNERAFGKPLLSTAGGPSLARGWNHRFLADYHNGSAEVALDETAEIDASRLEGIGQAERSALYTEGAVRYIRREWRTVPAILAKKLVGAVTPFSDPPRQGLLETGRVLFQAVTLIPLLWVVFMGGSRPLSVVVRALAVSYLLMALACFPALRYRFPLIWAEVLSLCLFLEAFGGRLLAWRRSP
jgi:4-amino-4-deoxy-L-arabinose transferase-like glycosyltransferase